MKKFWLANVDHLHIFLYKCKKSFKSLLTKSNKMKHFRLPRTVYEEIVPFIRLFSQFLPNFSSFLTSDLASPTIFFYYF
jgi:hypothetical protein